MPLVGLKGERVRLVPPDRTLHLENALVWLNDPDVSAMLQYDLGVTRRQEELFFEQIETQRDSDYTWAILDEQERHIGFIGLHGIHWRHRWATGGLVIGERSAWGRGYASDAVRVRTRFAFEQLGLHRIEGHTMNLAMKRVYEKCGYRHEGVARSKFWRNGRWHDADLFAILEVDWFGRGDRGSLDSGSLRGAPAARAAGIGDPDPDPRSGRETPRSAPPGEPSGRGTTAEPAEDQRGR